MSKHTPSEGDDLPKARIRHRRFRLPSIWVVPAVAALVAGYLVYRHVREYGPAITIRFRASDGLKPGQTPVQYRGAEIGQVKEVLLSKDHNSVSVKVKLRRNAISVTREGSVFWIVRPQIGMGELRGLGTIITGPYIEVLPGAGKPMKTFEGAENSPRIIDPQGLTVMLLSNDGGSLRAGIPIYYRGIEVGVVRDTRLSTNATAVEIYAVIRHRYAPLVRSNSKFWNVTGMDLRFGLFRGAELNVESLKSLLIGGIAFATPESGTALAGTGPPVFRLYEEAEKEWSTWAPRIPILPEASDEQEDALGKPRDLTIPTGTAR